MANSDYWIRKFERKDRPAVRQISCATAFLEYSKNSIFDDDEVLADALTLYFTDHEPGSSFVCVQDNKVVGYILGSLNVRDMDRVSNSAITGPLFIKALRRGVFFRWANLKFLFYVFKSSLKGEFFMPDFKEEFPATLHINIIKECRGRGIGEKLIETYLNFLKEKGVRGLHFGTFSEGAKSFFLKSGFTVLFHGKRTYLLPYLGKIVNFYVLGRKLSA